jgi:hypothetical protein
MERQLAADGVKTMASGDAGAAYKLFVYAQAAGSGAFVMAELLVNKAPPTLQATVKSDDAGLGQPFVQLLNGSLAKVC